MLTSFSTALSALSAQATAIDVVGNNLANLNTAGYKTSVVSFHDLVTQSMGAGLGETQVGFGVGKPTTIRHFSQGAIQSSTGDLDAAIQGDGFFVVRDSNNNLLYTRGGNLQVDKQGNLTTSTGEKLQGWTNISGAVDTNNPIGDIVIPVGALKEPKPTTTLSVDLNLNAAADTAVPEDANFSTSIETYDSLGNSHMLKFTFSKTAANTWHYKVDLPDGGATLDFTEGDLTFDENGHLLTPAAADGTLKIGLNALTDGAGDMSIDWNLYNGDTARITQFSQKSGPSAVAQDGSAAANLIRIGLADGGKIVAQYSNQDQKVVGQLAMALVRNPESLIAVGNNNFAVSARTALPAVGLPDTGGRGSVIGGSVEASTVDIAREFTNLIVFQRGYQANARVVTTVDELSQDTINLKR